NPAKLALVNPPPAGGEMVSLSDVLLTPKFPLNRTLTAFNASTGHGTDSDTSPPPSAGANNIVGLRGGAIPNAPQSGSAIATTGAEEFSELEFTALAASADTPFTVQLAGSMSFADGAALSSVAPLQATTNLANVPGVGNNAVTQLIPITAPASRSSISGFIYADTNRNGTFDRDANGVPTEMGLPNVIVTLSGSGQAQTTTGADGAYHFENVSPGRYNIDETQPAHFVDAGISLGIVLPPGTASGTTVGFNEFRQLSVGDGETAVDYNFGENAIPDKRMFLSSTNMPTLLAGQLNVAAVAIPVAAGDQVTIAPSATALNVTSSGGGSRQIPLSTAHELILEGSGSGSVILNGTDGNETADLEPGISAIRRGADFNGANFAVLALNTGNVTANAGIGNNLAVLRDTPHSDTLVSSGSTANLDSGQAEAVGFDAVRAVSLPRTNVMENDTSSTPAPATSFTLDLAGKWNSI
ncbi:MAG TPA: SdrD B-like domain-containing protein, partial [Pirellulales bacterium]|nr:SdrD B-like domain-containing protein [Pirellulales bacterium]